MADAQAVELNLPQHKHSRLRYRPPIVPRTWCVEVNLFSRQHKAALPGLKFYVVHYTSMPWNLGHCLLDVTVNRSPQKTLLLQHGTWISDGKRIESVLATEHNTKLATNLLISRQQYRDASLLRVIQERQQYLFMYLTLHSMR